MINRTLSLIRKKLLTWYDREARDLPWRRQKDPYGVWLSEVMLQQTQVDTVIPYYKRFLKQFPAVNKLAGADEETVLKCWEGLGYYRRARNLYQAAKIISATGFPKNAAQWILLPGIGRYSANAIASISVDEPVAVLDGNVKRVLARLFGYAEEVDLASSEKALWAMADQLLDHRRPGDFNQAMMEFGAVLCREALPKCLGCPVKSHCSAYKTGMVQQLPKRKKRLAIPHFNIVIAIIKDHHGRLLIGKRPGKEMLGGLWEFPGGKLEPGESNEAGLKREVKEECGISIRIDKKLGVIKHGYTHFKITMHAYTATATGGKLKAIYHEHLKWVTTEQLDNYALPGANKKLLPLLTGSIDQ